MSYEIFMLGELGETSFGIFKLGELGETSFGMSKLIELGEMSCGMTYISNVVPTIPIPNMIFRGKIGILPQCVLQ